MTAPPAESAFGQMGTVFAHYATAEDGQRFRDGATTVTWPVNCEFHDAAFQEYPDVVQRDGDDITVTMINGIALYRVNHTLTARPGWVWAKLAALEVREE